MGGFDANEAKKSGNLGPDNVNENTRDIPPPGQAAPPPFDLSKTAPSLKASSPGALALMRRRFNGEEKPLPLPWPDLAEVLGGGLWPGMHVLLGETGTGKTALALQIAHHAAGSGHPVLYVGLELDRAQIFARLLSLELGSVEGRPAVHWSKLYLGKSDPDAREAAQATKRLDALPIHIEEGVPGSWSVLDTRATLDALRAEYPKASAAFKAPLVVLDFLQLVGPTLPGEREELRERIGKAAYYGRELARRFGAAVLLLSSVGRDKAKPIAEFSAAFAGKGDAPPDPSGLVGLGKESGDIEFAADTVLALARDPRGKDLLGKGIMHLAVSKLRTGSPASCDLVFNGSWFEPRPVEVTA